jgi:hypothetical protein
MKFQVLPIVAMLALVGCASQYQIQPLSGSKHSVVLNKQGGVYITVPADGKYQDINYPGSGQLVAQTLAADFSKYARTVQTASSQAQDGGLSEARQAGSEYLVVPVITHWEQRATEWSGLPSRMSLRITIFDVASGQQLLSEGIEGRTSKMTFSSTSPDALLKKPIAEVVDSLYGKT